jgi:heme oxygenase
MLWVATQGCPKKKPLLSQYALPGSEAEHDVNIAVEPFKNNGLERGEALKKDIEWMTEVMEVPRLHHQPDGPGATYASLLRQLAADDLPAFICHYYNINFAHLAGGRMIGKMVSSAILDGAELEFYKYEDEPSVFGNTVKAEIEKLAETWSEDEQKGSVAQTPETFKYAGALLKCITQSCDCDCPRQSSSSKPAAEASVNPEPASTASA